MRRNRCANLSLPACVGRIQRQQTKWVVFGTVSSVLGLIGLQLASQQLHRIAPAQFGSPYSFVLLAGVHGFMLLIPLSIGVAILRNRPVGHRHTDQPHAGLWHPDRRSRTCLPRGQLQQTLRTSSPGVPGLGLRGRLDAGGPGAAQPRCRIGSRPIAIDRRFYRTRYDAQKILESFSNKLRDETDLGALNSELTTVVETRCSPPTSRCGVRPPES